MPANLEQVAASLRTAEQQRKPIAPMRDSIGPANAETAYAIQDINTRAALAAGRRLIGRKIGLTARAVQQQLGVDQPDYGMLFADMLVGNGAAIATSRVIQPRVEAEVALVLERDLANADASVADVISAVAYCLPALEIVDSRILNWDIKHWAACRRWRWRWRSSRRRSRRSTYWWGRATCSTPSPNASTMAWSASIFSPNLPKRSSSPTNR